MNMKEVMFLEKNIRIKVAAVTFSNNTDGSACVFLLFESLCCFRAGVSASTHLLSVTRFISDLLR